MYPICLSPQSQKKLKDKTLKERERLCKKIEELSNGNWKKGTKILRGIDKKNRRIYEARENRGDRLVFCMKYDSNNDDSQMGIYILDIDLTHDDITHTARNISLDKKFDFPEFNLKTIVKGNEDISLQSFINSEKKDYDFAQNIYWFEDENKFFLWEEEDWYRLINKESWSPEEEIEAKLKLAPEQQEILHKKLPLFVTGVAGSGKTTIGVYRLLGQPSDKKLYITNTSSLRDEAFKLFKKIIIGDDNYEKYVANTEFYTFEDLFTKAIGRHPNLLTKDKFVFEFKNKFNREPKQFFDKFPSDMVWEEIRSIIKSRVYSKEVLTLEEYKDIKKIPVKEAPNFSNVRDEFYRRIYQWYENELLIENSLEDELDVINSVTLEIQNSSLRYSLIICDEIQDLSMPHVSLILEMAERDPNRILLLGDDHQVINYSGFRWQSVQRLFYELNEKSDVFSLERNYRNPPKVFELSRRIMRLQEKLCPDYRFKCFSRVEESLPDVGRKPVLFKLEDETRLLKLLSKAGPGVAVIVGEDSDICQLKEMFQKADLQNPLIYSISQVKGLEFQAVVIWKLFNTTNRDKWNKVLQIGDQNQKLVIKDQRFVRDESSRLYVAVTRSLNKLFIYEDRKTEFWNNERFEGIFNIASSADDYREDFNLNITSEEWFDQGKYLFEKGRYSHALECFKRIVLETEDTTEWINVTEALIAKEEGNFEGAIKCFNSLGVDTKRKFVDNLAECYGNLNMYEEAKKLYQQRGGLCKDYSKELIYDIKGHISNKRWHAAGMQCNQKVKFITDNHEQIMFLNDAIKYFEQSKKEEPQNPGYLSSDKLIKECSEKVRRIQSQFLNNI